MALIKRLTSEQIRKQFTHYGWFAGLIPCYLSDDAECRLQERNWIPECALTATTWVYGQFIAAVSFFDEDYEPAWPIVITGEIAR